MNKKLAVLALASTILIIMSGINTSVLYGTQYLTTKTGYSYSLCEPGDWWNCNWSYCKKINIDYTKVASHQFDFPVLVYRSSDSDLASHAQNDGDDIVFVGLCNMTQYDHEIEYYNSSTGELWAWVEIPSLSSNADTIIYMYYGNPSCSSQENKNDVWDSGHHGVWHLNESSGLLEDSTSYENRYANVYGDPTYNVTGKIAGAMDFDGDGDYLRRRNRASLNFGTGDFTLECWVKTQETNSRYIMSKFRPYLAPIHGYALRISNGKLLASIGDGTGHDLGEGSKTINDNVWHHLVVVFDRDANGIYYVDGEIDKQTDISNWNGDTSNSLHNYLGYNDYALDPLYFAGIVDESRISSGVRSSTWVNTTYQNLNDPTNFTSFGSEVGVLSTWTYRKKITIESDLVDEDLINFPVLIYNASDNDLKNNALSNGNDIIFLNTSVGWTTGTWRDKLDHEIEKFESSTGEIEAWVRIPTLSNSTDTEIYMYYGNTLCTDNRENTTGVWDSNYMMVQHLQETGIGTRSDSTSNGNDGTPVGYIEDISIDNGKIDGADGFDGVDDHIRITDDSSLNFTSTMTVSLWVKANENPAQYDAIVTKDEDSWWDDGYGLWFNSISEIRFWVGSDYSTQFAKKTSVTTTDWNYVVGTCDGSIIKLYVNKVRGTDGSGAPTAVAATLELGRGHDNTYNLKGWLDEVRISNIERNSSWINASYNNVNDISSFLTFDSEEIKNVAPDLSNPNPANGATGQELNPSLSITANDINANLLNVSFWTNASGSWQRLGGYHEGYNGTYNDANATDMNSYNTTYYWSVNCSDGTTWTNSTYSFTTKEIHTYIVNSANANKAYKGDTLTWNTFPEGSEFSSSDYDAIDEDDDNYLSEIPGGGGAWRFHRFNFTIEENDDDIIDITVEWKGYAVQTGTYSQYLQWYNVHAGEWGPGDSSTTAGKDTLTKTWTGTFEGGCLDNGILQVAAIPGSSLDNGAELRSYYIVVNVTYIP